MAASGLPDPVENHAGNVAGMALAMLETMAAFNWNYPHRLDLRIGIHTGPTVAGVIGTRKRVYDVWGDTVNIASRMESHSLPGKIQVSEATYGLLASKYHFEDRGMIEVKGK